MENKSSFGTAGCMLGTVGTLIASTHLWLVISCAVLTGISLVYTIINAKAKGRLQDLQFEHERMLLCLDCLKNGVNGQCSIPPDQRPRNCPRKNDKYAKLENDSRGNLHDSRSGGQCGQSTD